MYEQVELPPPDLGPTASLNLTLALLREVLTSHDSSVVPLDARQADFAQVKMQLPLSNLSVEFKSFKTPLVFVYQCGTRNAGYILCCDYPKNEFGMK